MHRYIAYTILFMGFALSVAGMAFGASIDNAVLMAIYGLPGVAFMFSPALVGVQS